MFEFWHFLVKIGIHLSLVAYHCNGFKQIFDTTHSNKLDDLQLLCYTELYYHLLWHEKHVENSRKATSENKITMETNNDSSKTTPHCYFLWELDLFYFWLFTMHSFLRNWGTSRSLTLIEYFPLYFPANILFKTSLLLLTTHVRILELWHCFLLEMRNSTDKQNFVVFSQRSFIMKLYCFFMEGNFVRFEQKPILIYEEENFGF